MTPKGPPPRPSVKAHRYELPGGWIVLAGKSDDDNDRLSLEVAGQRDHWFHVHGMPGSHVILIAHEGEEPSKEVLKQAAAIAAWHSKARTAGVVSVSCTLAANVSKPHGAKPGTVHILREKMFKVRPAVPGGEEASR